MIDKQLKHNALLVNYRSERRLFYFLIANKSFVMTVASVVINQNDQAQDWQGSPEDASAVLMYLQVEGSLKWLKAGHPATRNEKWLVKMKSKEENRDARPDTVTKLHDKMVEAMTAGFVPACTGTWK